MFVYSRVKLLKARDKTASPEWLSKLPQMVKQLEVSLYRSASSFEEYSDHSTLKYRLQQLAIEIAKKTNSPRIKIVFLRPLIRNDGRLVVVIHLTANQGIILTAVMANLRSISTLIIHHLVTRLRSNNNTTFIGEIAITNPRNSRKTICWPGDSMI